MKKLALAAVAAAILAGAAPAWGARPLTAETSLGANWLYFGDTVTARVDVLADRRRVDVRSVRLEASFEPWQQLEPARSSSGESGPVVRRTWSFTLVCIKVACLPPGTGVERFPLPPATVTARNLDGSILRLRADWPKVNVAGRFKPLPSADVTPPFRLQTAMPAATYRRSPTSLALLLDGVGIVAIAVGFGLVARELARWWSGHHRPIDRRRPVDRALALVREAQLRDAGDRRRAAGLLARTLSKERDGLTAAASQLAWSRPEPSPDRLEEFADIVETKSEESR